MQFGREGFKITGCLQQMTSTTRWLCKLQTSTIHKWNIAKKACNTHIPKPYSLRVPNKPEFRTSYQFKVWFRFMVFNATFNNISVILWWSVLLVEETEVPRENHWPGLTLERDSGEEVALWRLTSLSCRSKAKFKSPCNFEETPYVVARVFSPLVIYENVVARALLTCRK